MYLFILWYKFTITDNYDCPEKILDNSDNDDGDDDYDDDDDGDDAGDDDDGDDGDDDDDDDDDDDYDIWYMITLPTRADLELFVVVFAAEKQIFYCPAFCVISTRPHMYRTA